MENQIDAMDEQGGAHEYVHRGLTAPSRGPRDLPEDQKGSREGSHTVYEEDGKVMVIKTTGMHPDYGEYYFNSHEDFIASLSCFKPGVEFTAEAKMMDKKEWEEIQSKLVDMDNLPDEEEEKAKGNETV